MSAGQTRSSRAAGAGQEMLVANRSEIAIRVFARAELACARCDLRAGGRLSVHRFKADERISSAKARGGRRVPGHLGHRVAGEGKRRDLIHPGYGFLRRTAISRRRAGPGHHVRGAAPGVAAVDG